MISNDNKPTLEDPWMFNEAWNHPNKDSQKNGKMLIARNLPT